MKAANFLENLQSKIDAIPWGEYKVFDLEPGLGLVLMKDESGKVVKKRASKVKIVKGSSKARAFIKTAYPYNSK